MTTAPPHTGHTRLMCSGSGAVVLVDLHAVDLATERHAEEISAGVSSQGSGSFEGWPDGGAGRRRSADQRPDDLQLATAELIDTGQLPGRRPPTWRNWWPPGGGSPSWKPTWPSPGVPTSCSRRRCPQKRGTRPTMAAEGLPVQVACRVVGVAESGFYAWRMRAPPRRSVRHAWLVDVIRQVHVASHGVDGGRRVHAELTLGRGVSSGTARWRCGCAGPGSKGCPATSAGTPCGADRGRSGRPAVQLRCARPAVGHRHHRTSHPGRQGDCAVVLDVYSRRVVGWSIDATQTAALVTNALGMAITNRNPAAGAQ
jgi:hypothetical protein